MTPARLNELRCPTCTQASWILDSDYRDTDGVMLPYEQRVYPCRHCGNTGADWTLMQQAPPEFLLQPHPLYPMTQADFDHWVAILKANVPDHPRLSDVGKDFVPRIPGGIAARLWHKMTGR